MIFDLLFGTRGPVCSYFRLSCSPPHRTATTGHNCRVMCTRLRPCSRHSMCLRILPSCPFTAEAASRCSTRCGSAQGSSCLRGFSVDESCCCIPWMAHRPCCTTHTSAPVCAPLQLSWPYNYAAFSAEYFGTIRTLVSNPDLVAQSATLVLGSALWFYMSPQV